MNIEHVKHVFDLSEVKFDPYYCGGKKIVPYNADVA